MSRPGYPFPGLTVQRVQTILAELVHLEGHLFWPDAVSLLDPARFNLAAVTPKHLTDLYLLRLAASHRGRLVTFDRTIRTEPATGATPQNLELPPGDRSQTDSHTNHRRSNALPVPFPVLPEFKPPLPIRAPNSPTISPPA